MSLRENDAMGMRLCLLKLAISFALAGLGLLAVLGVIFFMPFRYSSEDVLNVVYSRICHDISVEHTHLKYLGGVFGRESEIVFSFHGDKSKLLGFRRVFDKCQRKDLIDSCSDLFSASNLRRELSSDCELQIRYMDTYTLLVVEDVSESYLIYLGAQ